MILAEQKCAVHATISRSHRRPTSERELRRGGIKARPGSLSVLSVLRLGRGLKSIKEQPGSFYAIFRKFLGRVLLHGRLRFFKK